MFDDVYTNWCRASAVFGVFGGVSPLILFIIILAGRCGRLLGGVVLITN